jgi:hypothetical protein
MYDKALLPDLEVGFVLFDIPLKSAIFLDCKLRQAIF